MAAVRRGLASKTTTVHLAAQPDGESTSISGNSPAKPSTLLWIQLPNGQLRDHLMGLYLRLGAYPEVEKTLTRLKAGGLKCAILSNGSPTMLSASVENAGIADLLDAVLSVEELKVYKPYPTVYQLAVDRLSLKASAICYVSSNGWDAYSAKAFGFHLIWCNRSSQVPERIPETPMQ